MPTATTRTTTVVVGAGHSGLAVSRCLADRSIDHVVLERGQVAASWRTQRWDSLRLLTPTWMTRLPGHTYAGDEPDGFLTAAEVADLVTGYGRDLPVRTGVEVTAVRPLDGGFEVRTSEGTWTTDTVVLAAGLTRGVVPALAEALPDNLVSLHAIDYKNPGQLPDGGVLVVGPSSSGVQIAGELELLGDLHAAGGGADDQHASVGQLVGVLVVDRVEGDDVLGQRAGQGRYDAAGQPGREDDGVGGPRALGRADLEAAVRGPDRGHLDARADRRLPAVVGDECGDLRRGEEPVGVVAGVLVTR